MTRGQWLRRSARYHARRHLGTLIGGVVATTTITASLLVGRSVRDSLDRLARLRLGDIEFAVEMAVPAPWPPNLADAHPSFAGRRVARALIFDGMASAPDHHVRVGHVRVIGVDEHFFKFFVDPSSSAASQIPEGEVWLAQAVASRLQVGPGDELVIRVPTASVLPSDMPLGTAPAAWSAARWRVGRVLSDESGGRFDLRPSLLAPMNLFVRHDSLAALSGRPNAVNLLLIGTGPCDQALETIRLAVEATADPAARNFECRALVEGGAELRSAGVFLSAESVAFLTNALLGGRPVFTYLINAVRSGGRIVPYSFAAGLMNTPVGEDTRSDEVIIHSDLANDLHVQEGDIIHAEYFVLNTNQQLVETQATFRVRSITSQSRDPSLVPDLAGIGQASSCREWRTPLPIDFSRIRAVDEADWQRWRGAPKMWLRYDTAVSLWSNRFGIATAVRWPPPVTVADLEQAVRRMPLAVRFADVRQMARRAASGGPDFALLFLGLSVFLLASALMLQIWIFAAGLAGRDNEIRLLVSLGFPRGEIAWLILVETAWVALGAALLGAAAGVGLAHALVAGLRSIWRDAASGASLRVAIHLIDPAVAAMAGWVAAMLTAGYVVRHRMLTSPARTDHNRPQALRPGAYRLALALVMIALVSVLCLIVSPRGPTQDTALLRLAAGALSIFAIAMSLHRWLVSQPGSRGSVPAVFGPRRWQYQPRRALAAIFIPACGWFVMFAVETHRPRTPDIDSRSSPAGGFCAMIETSLGLPHDPASPEGRRLWRLDEILTTPGVRLISLRRVEGVSADCRNIQRVDRPPLLGVPTAVFDELGAFRWRRMGQAVSTAQPWSALRRKTSPDELPVVMDASVATWGLRVRLGDRIPMIDERGESVWLRVVGLLDDTIFQGSLILDEARLLERFPSAPRRVLLVEAPADQRAHVRTTLADSLEDWGSEWVSTLERLEALRDVYRAYLDIFLTFSALGLALGALGFGTIAWRTLLERRSELAMLLALGWTPRRLWRRAATEQWLQAWSGLAIGFAAALIAFPPRAEGWSAWLRVSGLAAVALGVIGTVSVHIAIVMMARGPLLPHLRRE